MRRLSRITLVCLVELGGFGLLIAGLLAEDALSLSAFLLSVCLIAYGVKRFPEVWRRIVEDFKATPEGAFLGLAVLTVLLPLVMRRSPYWIFVLTLAALFALIALGLNLQLGTTGLMNLAGAAFYGVGAYTVGLLTTRVHVPVGITLLLAPFMSALVGVLLFVPILKTRGHYLALVTIAFGIIFTQVVNNLEWTGGPQGIKNIPMLSVGNLIFTRSLRLFGLSLPYHANFFWLIVALTGGVTFLLSRLHNSWPGLVLNTIRDDETAARCFGVDAAWWKLLSFTLGNLIMGLAGALYAVMVGYIAPANFTFGDSLIMVGIVILGGMDSIPGVLVGATLLLVLPEKFRFLQAFRLMLYGVTIVVMLLFRPRGLLPVRVRRYGLAVSGGGLVLPRREGGG